MSRREKEKKASLDALSRIAYSAGTAPPAAAPKPRAPTPAPAPKRAAPPPPVKVETAADRARKKQLMERREKLEEERKLKARRAGELARGSNLEWRGMDTMGVPKSIRRTGFDRDEATVAQKLADILGETKEKEGRAKAKAKGKRQGGR